MRERLRERPAEKMRRTHLRVEGEEGKIRTMNNWHGTPKKRHSNKKLKNIRHAFLRKLRNEVRQKEAGRA